MHHRPFVQLDTSKKNIYKLSLKNKTENDLLGYNQNSTSDKQRIEHGFIITSLCWYDVFWFLKFE